jgi:ferritin
MKLLDSLNNAFNEQITHEYRNQLIYTQLESIFEDFQLKNIAKYFHEQSLHEKSHGDKIVGYLNDRTGGKVNIREIDSPIIPFYTIDTLANIGDLYISTEESTTESLESIYDFALGNKSYIDLPLLSDMLQEQVEEEDSANEFALNIKMTKDLVLFDKSFSGG